MLTREQLITTPKAELHVHLDGSLRASTLIDLADQQNVQLPSHDEKTLKKELGFTGRYASLDDCLKAFQLTTLLMQDENSLRRIARELAEDAANEGTKYIEVRFAPCLHTSHGISEEQALEAVIDGLQDARKSHNIRGNVIVCAIRNMSPELSLEMADLAVMYGNCDEDNVGVVGFDLAGDEAGFPPVMHVQALNYVTASSGKIWNTIHAGESAGPEYIRQAIELGALRIGHGCCILEDPSLVQLAIDNDVVLECCITSNWQTGAIEHFSQHPLKQFLQAGLKVTINTDNRLIHDTTLVDELMLAQRELQLTDDEIQQVITSAFQSRFSYDRMP